MVGGDLVEAKMVERERGRVKFQMNRYEAQSLKDLGHEYQKLSLG